MTTIQEHRITMKMKHLAVTVIIAWTAMSSMAVSFNRPVLVDWGHDWGSAWYRQRADQESNSPWRNLADEDLNGNGTTEDDQIRGWPFDDDVPLSPQNIVYDYTYPSARFYGAAIVSVTDLPQKEDGSGFINVSAPSEGHINQNHELRDDWNLMSMPSIKREPERSRYAGAMLVYWKKEDFLNGGDRFSVALDDDSYIGVFVSRYWGGINWGRWVIRQNGQFYISEATFAGQTEQFDLTDSSPDNGARNPVVRTTHTINPSSTRWALYHPEAPHKVFFDSGKAEFNEQRFDNIDGVGFLAQRDLSIGRPVAGGLWDLPHGLGEPIALKFNAVQVRARIAAPAGWSSVLTMEPVPDASAEATATRRPVRYHEWLKVWRWAVSNQRASRFSEGFERYEMGGYSFLNDAAMGRMATGRYPSHTPAEPVTMISWHDAILWCNALSEKEGLEPAYYADPGHTTPLRSVFDRSKKELRDERPAVYWKQTATGYRLPTLAEWSALQTDGAGAEEPPISEYIWDADGASYDPARQTHRVVAGASDRTAEEPTLMPFGEKPFEGSYDISFRVLRAPANALSAAAGLNPATRTLRPDDIIRPARVMPEEQLRSMAEKILGLIPVAGAGGLPDNDNHGRAYPETGHYDLAFARAETPYTLWNLVRQWASMNRGYRFNHAGDMGSLQYTLPGVDTFTYSREEPVTHITWLDAVVWCNALSELMGRDPVYRTQSTGEPLRDANTHRVPMYAEYAYPNTGRYANRPVDTGAVIDLKTETGRTGFRLPTLAEFEAAHERSPSLDHGWFAENSGGKTHPVGAKQPNTRGLYDMDGNVQEMTFGDCNLFGQIRAGNTFADPAGIYPHSMTRKELPAVGRSYLGFRVVARPQP